MCAATRGAAVHKRSTVNLSVSLTGYRNQITSRLYTLTVAFAALVASLSASACTNVLAVSLLTRVSQSPRPRAALPSTNRKDNAELSPSSRPRAALVDLRGYSYLCSRSPTGVSPSSRPRANLAVPPSTNAGTGRMTVGYRSRLALAPSYRPPTRAREG